MLQLLCLRAHCVRGGARKYARIANAALASSHKIVQDEAKDLYVGACVSIHSWELSCVCMETSVATS